MPVNRVLIASGLTIECVLIAYAHDLSQAEAQTNVLGPFEAPFPSAALRPPPALVPRTWGHGLEPRLGVCHGHGLLVITKQSMLHQEANMQSIGNIIDHIASDIVGNI